MSYLRTNRVKLNEARTLRETCSGKVKICCTDIFEDYSIFLYLYRREYKSLLHIFVDFFVDWHKSDAFIPEFFRTSGLRTTTQYSILGQIYGHTKSWAKLPNE